MGFDPYDDAFDERDWETPVDGTVRIAVVGLGSFGRDQAIPSIEASDYCELGAVVSGSREKAERVGDERDATPLTYDEFHDGEATGDYDACYVVTPNALHLPHVEAAAEFGKDVLCEKPLEATVERAEALVETAESGDLRLMTAYRVQCHPPTRRVREAVADGFVGDVVHVDGAFAFDMLAGDPEQWRFDPDLAGGGALYDIGVYPLNTTRFVLDADPVAVQASVTRDQERLGGMDRDVAFQLEFPGDVVATCRASYESANENVLRIVGTEGKIEIERAYAIDAERTITVERGGTRTRIQAEHHELAEAFDYFANHVLADEPIGPDGEHGLDDMRTVAAVYESDERGERVEL